MYNLAIVNRVNSYLVKYVRIAYSYIHIIHIKGIVHPKMKLLLQFNHTLITFFCHFNKQKALLSCQGKNVTDCF